MPAHLSEIIEHFDTFVLLQGSAKLHRLPLGEEQKSQAHFQGQRLL